MIFSRSQRLSEAELKLEPSFLILRPGPFLTTLCSNNAAHRVPSSTSQQDFCTNHTCSFIPFPKACRAISRGVASSFFMECRLDVRSHVGSSWELAVWSFKALLLSSLLSQCLCVDEASSSIFSFP